MRFQKECDLVEVKTITSRDNTKVYYHAKFLADDIMIECQFIPKEVWLKIKDLPRLTTVLIQFDVLSSGTNEQNNMTYRFKLDDFVGLVQSKK